ncbi:MULTISPECIES: ATP-binding protein [Sorangium]|uniref:ATP-binding protein n=1 Tax=Sorangium TaxID=39643 RepID=UPI003D9C1F21
MNDSALKFDQADVIGRVAAVDTSRVYISAEDHVRVTRIGIGNVFAIAGSTTQEFIICIAERVTRDTRQSLIFEEEDDEGNVPRGERLDDTICAVLIGTFRTVEGARRNVFKRGADSFPQVDRDCYIIEANNLQNLMNLLASDVPEAERLRLGHFVIDRTAVAVADGNRFFQRHAAILGSTGSGKSWSVALILERAKALKYPNIIVFDMHGEYTPLSNKNKNGFASSYRIAGPGDLDKPAEDVLFLPHWLLNREEMLSMLLDRSDHNAPNQAARFTEHVRLLKDAALARIGKEDVRRTFTVDSPIPYAIEDLIRLLDEDDKGTKISVSTGKPIKGDWTEKLTRFLARLSAKCEDRRYGFLFKGPPTTKAYDWLGRQISNLLGSDSTRPGIKIIDFSEVPSDVLPVVVGVFARLLYDVQFWMDARSRTPVTLVCDEAHLYLPVREGADSVQAQALEAFESIAKEGRKYGISLLVVSQRPHDVSRTILSQCNNFLVLRLTNDQDQNVVRRLMPDSMVGLTDILPLLDVGEALLLGDAVLLPTRIKLDTPELRPDSATRNFWSDWGTRAPDVDAISNAVESLRRQTRPAGE